MNSREEVAAKAGHQHEHEDGSYEFILADVRARHIKTAERMLAAADAHDAAHGVHRVSLDEATVERAARALWGASGYNEDDWVYMPPEDELRRACIADARAVLAAAVGGDGE